MHRHAQEFTLSRRAVGTLVGIDPNLDRIKLKVSGCTCSHVIEIGRPYGSDQVRLGKMAQKAIADMRSGFADDIGEIGAPVVCDRKALPDVEAVFLGRIFFGKATMAVEPALDATAHALERQFDELFLKSGIVGEEYLTLPFPDAHLRRWHAGAGRSPCAEKESERGRTAHAEGANES